ncbi:unnamed protein product [Trifolium pratense]|uniref:Uncharacterized protein n=1 Tax=Trifolium pratense TaxID=57577 RepID=A0ACB0JLG0_TRIPR|nr:unnamed protein product [Trifolium pratense]
MANHISKCLIFFFILATIAALQVTVEAGMCSIIYDKCSVVKDCHSFCNSRVQIEKFDSLLGWFCDQFNLCTCFFNYVPSKHLSDPTRRCTIGGGPCDIANHECNSMCTKFKDAHGSCFDNIFLGVKMCVCNYSS